MLIDYAISKLVIEGFRGIEKAEFDFRNGFPTVLIGSNNAGKSTILNALALALNGGGFHQWSPEENDFFCGQNGERRKNFLIQLYFRSENELGYPAVKGVAAPTLIHGVQVKGTVTKDGLLKHSRTLFDKDGKTVTIAPRTSLSATDKVEFAEHDIGYKLVNARLDDIRNHIPSVWLFRPQNLEASLYVWKTGPIAKLSGHLAERFLTDEWEMELNNGTKRAMPKTMHNAYAFFRDALEQFPFWTSDMKPHLEEVIGKYVGTNAKVDLRPDAQVFKDWISQQLMIALATDPESVSTPLRNMGDGWQSIIRLAALEALTKYPALTKERIVLLLEEPETHLHPHFRRKLRKILADLADKGWMVVYSTHSPELISFDENQSITRLARKAGNVSFGTVMTDEIAPDAKFQSKLDEKGAHDFLFSNGVVFCEGMGDAFAVRSALGDLDLDCDGRSISVTQAGGISGIPSLAAIAKLLGIRWCAVTDEDLLPDGTIKPATVKHRANIDQYKTATDFQVQWSVDLEQCLRVEVGKATPEISAVLLQNPDWQSAYPEFYTAVLEIANWLERGPPN
ncbi:MAG: DUF2813 domain-containing protein [Proteobacteria bacterium]|nr:MAG: DUF2813 domain-containing protein [Pseudomonadota bacterium]